MSVVKHEHNSKTEYEVIVKQRVKQEIFSDYFFQYWDKSTKLALFLSLSHTHSLIHEVFVLEICCFMWKENFALIHKNGYSFRLT